MASLTLIDALNSIGEGRSAEILDQLHHLHQQSPLDIATSYVLAHALEACDQGTRAESIWKTASLLQAKDESPVIPEPTDIPVFEHTSTLAARLDEIIGEEDDEIQQLIMQLESAGRPNLASHESVIDEPVEEEEFSDTITETFARILVAQKQYAEASSVYRSLSEQHPDERDRFLREVERLEALINSELDSDSS